MMLDVQRVIQTQELTRVKWRQIERGREGSFMWCTFEERWMDHLCQICLACAQRVPFVLAFGRRWPCIDSYWFWTVEIVQDTSQDKLVDISTRRSNFAGKLEMDGLCRRLKGESGAYLPCGSALPPSAPLSRRLYESWSEMPYRDHASASCTSRRRI